jgi:hypothetical protein
MSTATEHPDEGNKGRVSNPTNRIKNLTKKLNRQRKSRATARQLEMQEA